jgi:hypothetical protein
MNNELKITNLIQTGNEKQNQKSVLTEWYKKYCPFVKFKRETKE